MKTVAVTGATGFLGNFVAQYLEKHGYNIVRFGRRQQDGVLFWDITQGTYSGVAADVVVHCAASVSDWAGEKESFAANVTGTQHVVDSFPLAKHFIYISSASVYDAFCLSVIVEEETCIGGNVLNSYSRTKLAGERIALAAKVPARTVLRPHIIYGPGDRTIGPRIRKSIRAKKLFIPGNGTNRISFTHVENLAHAILRTIEIEKEGSAVYNITDAESFMLSDVIKNAKKLNNLHFKTVYIPRKLAFGVGSILEFVFRLFRSKKPPMLTRYIVQQMASDHILDIGKAKRELGYSPTKSVPTDFFI
jgi:nucleoside-diphosphate-sugar epimerase